MVLQLTGVVLCLLGVFVFGVLGINVGYHRLLTHRGFKSPLWLERTLTTLGVCCAQDSPPHWVAVHRRHHQFTDEEGPAQPAVDAGDVLGPRRMDDGHKRITRPRPLINRSTRAT